MKYQVDEKGFYGDFGGAYIPEMLYPNVEELRQNYIQISESDSFKKQGEELAYFKMGSTVIILIEDSNKLDLDSLKENKLVKFGDNLISLKSI